MYEDIVDQFYEPDMGSLKVTRFRAIITCLTGEELCDFALAATDGRLSLKLREFINDLVVAAIDKGGWQDYCHLLISKLLTDLDDILYRVRQRRMILISRLLGCEHMPEQIKDDLRHLLLSSRYASERGRGYVHIDENTDADSLLLNNWNQHGDYGALAAIIRYASEELLNQNYERLLEAVREDEELYDYQVLERQLYVRATLNENRLSGLRQRSGLTYAYVAAKKHLTMSEDEALALWEQYKTHEKSGVLIWAFGQCNLWNVVTALDLD